MPEQVPALLTALRDVHAAVVHPAAWSAWHTSASPVGVTSLQWHTTCRDQAGRKMPKVAIVKMPKKSKKTSFVSMIY
jgi:hypothetical protein